ncbi:hypothetical protein [Microbulbifer sp. JSM ZJ756]|uniref:hypothetical protein n=1 Tax=Microbulbifer sp. JSM ZJ756 TaxID=3376191 RepID=UPI00378B611D
MNTTSNWRGHPITWDYTGERWIYADTSEPTLGNRRPCGHCGKPDTPEGHDGCLGSLPGVMNACCGHGCKGLAYVQYPNGRRLAGTRALREIRRLQKSRTGKKPLLPIPAAPRALQPWIAAGLWLALVAAGFGIYCLVS